MAEEAARRFPVAARGDDDPLEELIRSLPFGSTSSEILKGALTSILERFRSDHRYRNDERYLKLWMRYADLTDNANKVFLALECEKIGTQLALFWAAWAYVLEIAESYTTATERIAEGRKIGARPITLLEDFSRSFRQRMLERAEAARSESGGGIGITEDDDAVSHLSRGIQCSLLRRSEPPEITAVESRRNISRIVLAGFEPEDMSGKDGDWAGYTASRAGSVASMGGLKVRDANSRDQAAPRRKGYHTPDTLNSPSQASVAAESPSTIARLIRDPFSPDKRRRLTTETTQFLHWANSSGKVHDFRDDSLGRWPRKMADANVRSRHLVDLTRTLGTQRLDVMGLLGKGSFATVFSCKTSEDRRDVAVKIEREDMSPSLPWECFITLQLSERLLCQGQREDDSVRPPPISVVRPEGLFLYRDGCAMTMPRQPSGTLHDLVARYAKRARTMPQLVVMHYAVEMLRFCRAMHATSIMHMDIKPDNWLLTRGAESDVRHSDNRHSLSLIDFGKAIDLSTLPQNGSGMAFVGQCCASSFSCPAMTEGSPWKYDADLYALGSCIYFMLHGVYLEVSCEQDAGSTLHKPGHRWRPVKKCKRYWEVDLWDNLFNELLNSGLQATGIAGAHTVLNQLEESLASYLRVYQRSRELQECLRQQDNMFSDR